MDLLPFLLVVCLLWTTGSSQDNICPATTTQTEGGSKRRLRHFDMHTVQCRLYQQVNWPDTLPGFIGSRSGSTCGSHLSASVAVDPFPSPLDTAVASPVALQHGMAEVSGVDGRVTGACPLCAIGTAFESRGCETRSFPPIGIGGGVSPEATTSNGSWFLASRAALCSHVHVVIIEDPPPPTQVSSPVDLITKCTK